MSRGCGRSAHQQLIEMLDLVELWHRRGPPPGQPASVVQQIVFLCELYELRLEAFVDQDGGALHLGSPQGVKEGDTLVHHHVCYRKITESDYSVHYFLEY